MEHFRVRPLSEPDIDPVIAAAGGSRAHNNADRRDRQGADYLLNEALIELKALDDEGLAKPERQAKLAALFLGHEKTRPVVVLDRARLSESARRTYDRILEGPIKSAVNTARKQLKQSRAEYPTTTTSVLFVLNNGYTALDHDALVRMISHRVRNDTKEIDGIVVAGCYFYSDTFDSFFFWPIDYVPINLHRPFASYEKLRDAWHEHAQDFMTAVMRGQLGPDTVKGPVIDTQFDINGVTYVKPAPPMGAKSNFFVKGRPRKDSSGLTYCPPVATTFPDMTFDEWKRFREALPTEATLFSEYDEWLSHRAAAAAVGTALQPFVAMPVTHTGWEAWCSCRRLARHMSSIREYANELFEERLRIIIASSRERLPASVIPSRYILSVTEEIGQDRANDLSHIAAVRERPNADPSVHPLLTDARIFHEHALALACAHAVAQGVECVLWQKDQRYAWV